MTGLFISIDEYAEDPVEWEVERAIKILSADEEYDEYPSVMNPREHRETGRKCRKKYR